MCIITLYIHCHRGFPSVLWHCLFGDRKVIRPVKIGCWFVDGDDLTGALHVLWLQLSPPPPSPLAPMESRKETFWYRLTQVHLENGRWKREIHCRWGQWQDLLDVWNLLIFCSLYDGGDKWTCLVRITAPSPFIVCSMVFVFNSLKWA